ncbi:MAG: hypothetical protein KGD58_11630 [Candidatus Lokiarchaeota archaeon]|nr:hypothetical protein [Candidatus Lokiarchaeota archaeon]
MLTKSGRNFKSFIFLGLIVLLGLTAIFSSFNVNTKINEYEFESRAGLNTAGIVTRSNIQWLENPTFADPIQPTWFSEIKGDPTDINPSTSTGQVNFDILGSTGQFSNVSGTPSDSDWSEFNNTYFILPDGTHEINVDGCEASHEFQENTDQSRNRPSVHWRRNITMPVSMEDFIITSVSLSAVVNGSADTNVETPNDDLSYDGAGYFATYYDYARFYIKFSNLDYVNLYEVAYFQTVDLGEGNQTRQATGIISYLYDTLMATIDQSTLIFYLTKALEDDPYHFGITLGIDIYCEDNYDQADRDTFYSLLIKSVNLSFTYEKKMNQLTYLSWNQIGEAINGSNIEITKSNLNFEYKISESWPDILSPNSEIRILINNIPHIETIKLGSASTSFQEAKVEGYDLLDITPPYVNINFSIQVILGDEFGLNRTITVSIDNVYLVVSYKETISDPQPVSEPLIFRILLIVASIIAGCLGGYLVAYQKVLKYPHAVRKVRKFKRTLKKKSAPSTDITSREKAFNKSYKKELSASSKYTRGKPSVDPGKEQGIAKTPSDKGSGEIKGNTTNQEGGKTQ